MNGEMQLGPKILKGEWEWGRAGGLVVFLSLYKRIGLGFWLGLGLAIQFVYPDVVMVIFYSPI